MTRLLLSARDAGAAGHLCRVAQAARQRSGLRTTVVADGPALHLFAAAGVDVRPFPGGGVTAADGPAAAAAVVAAARDLIDEIAPDAVLVGLSQPGTGGVDEALLAVAESGRRFAFQDFWGDVNGFFGAVADHYLVIDDVAATETRRRTGGAVSVVGAPKYAAYAGLDVTAAREQARATWQVGPEHRVCVVFGQPLWRFPGYAATLRAVAEVAGRGAAGSGALPWRLVYRPHPAEPEEAVRQALDLWAEAGAEGGQRDASPDVVRAIAGADACLSVFSTTALDAAYLARMTGAAVAPSLAMLWEPDLLAYYRESSGLDTLPLHDLGLAEGADGPDGLRRFLEAVEQGRAAAALRQRVAALPAPDTAAERVVDVVLGALGALGE